MPSPSCAPSKRQKLLGCVPERTLVALQTSNKRSTIPIIHITIHITITTITITTVTTHTTIIIITITIIIIITTTTTTTTKTIMTIMASSGVRNARRAARRDHALGAELLL
jgi:hypothetical protein